MSGNPYLQQDNNRVQIAGHISRQRNESPATVHPHTAELVPLNWDDTWRETLVAQSIPFNIGLLQLEVRLSQDYTFYPRLANPSGTGHLGKSVTVPKGSTSNSPKSGPEGHPHRRDGNFPGFVKLEGMY